MGIVRLGFLIVTNMYLVTPVGAYARPAATKPVSMRAKLLSRQVYFVSLNLVSVNAFGIKALERLCNWLLIDRSWLLFMLLTFMRLSFPTLFICGYTFGCGTLTSS